MRGLVYISWDQIIFIDVDAISWTNQAASIYVMLCIPAVHWKWVHFGLHFQCQGHTSVSIMLMWSCHTASSSVNHSLLQLWLYYMSWGNNDMTTLREESSQATVILQYKLLAPILSAVCSVIQQSQYVLHFYYTL